MFLALAIAVVLCGADSSLAPSLERARRLNKREEGIMINDEEGPGVNMHNHCSIGVAEFNTTLYVNIAFLLALN